MTLLLRRDKKRTEKPFKKAFKDVKKLSKDDAEELYNANLWNVNDKKSVYRSLKSSIRSIMKTSNPRLVLEEWQELNNKIYAKLLRDKYLKKLKRKVK